jgi:hypothetical protein
MKHLIALLFSITAYGVAVDGNATVTTVKGTGKVEATPVAKGSIILNGQRISTDKDSQATLWLSNGSRMVVNANAIVLFKVMKQEEGSLQPPNPEDKSLKETGASITEIEVEAGKVIGDVKKLVPNSIYTLKTPVGTVSIKGTVFSVEYKKNDDGTVAFNIGCLVGRVTVQMADPNVAPVSVPAGKQLSVSAPPPNASGNPQGGGDKPAPPPPMKMEVAPMPAKEMMAINISNLPPAAMAPPPPNAPPPPKTQAQALDKIIQETEQAVKKGQIDPSPTGG